MSPPIRKTCVEAGNLSVDALIAVGPTFSTVGGAATLAANERSLNYVSASGPAFDGVMGSDAYVAGNVGAGPLTYTNNGGYHSDNVSLGTIGSAAATANAAAYTAAASPGSVVVANSPAAHSSAANAAMASATSVPVAVEAAAVSAAATGAIAAAASA